MDQLLELPREILNIIIQYIGIDEFQQFKNNMISILPDYNITAHEWLQMFPKSTCVNELYMLINEYNNTWLSIKHKRVYEEKIMKYGAELLKELTHHIPCVCDKYEHDYNITAKQYKTYIRKIDYKDDDDDDDECMCKYKDGCDFYYQILAVARKCDYKYKNMTTLQKFAYNILMHIPIELKKKIIVKNIHNYIENEYPNSMCHASFVRNITRKFQIPEFAKEYLINYN